jgi:hypothetical protein
MPFILSLLIALLVRVPNVEQPGFLGLSIGMKAQDAFRVASEPLDALQKVKPYSGHKVVSDTLPITRCSLGMRRSLAFDSTEVLTAIGLTYKTDANHIERAGHCALDWLKETYGEPMGTALRDSAIQVVWKYNGVLLTFETRNYNPNDYFVLIYYYKNETGE